MKLCVGLPKIATERFIEAILERKAQICEVYFAWGDFPNGRGSQAEDERYTPWELMDRQREVLACLSKAGIQLNLLLNAACYGRDSQSRAFFEKIGQTTDYLCERYSLSSVTTTSPLIARFMKQNFEGLDVRASVNMGVGSERGMAYIAEYFDSYYVRRECNRDLAQVKRLHDWAAAHGKRLYLLANSGCLNDCSAHTFHDSLVAHEQEIARMDNAYEFPGICREFLRREENLSSLITDTSFIRPEDISRYEPYVEAVKLATRVNPHPERVLAAYASGRYSGNLLDLLEPAHCVYPYVLENGDPPRLVRLPDDAL